MRKKHADKDCKPPINRARWHDIIDREQKNLLKADGKADAYFGHLLMKRLTYLVTRALMQKVEPCSVK